MPGSPVRRERKLANQAAHRAKLKGITIDEAAQEIEAEQGKVLGVAVPSTGHSDAAPVPGETYRAEIEAARIKIRTEAAEWLIGTPAEIKAAFTHAKKNKEKFTPELQEAFLHLIRAGIPIKGMGDGEGAAQACGMSAPVVWQFIHDNPEFANRYRDARDASSEVLEDEVRSLIPTMLKRPEMLDSIKLVVERLEWLAKVRNRPRYGNDKQQTGSQNVTFNIGTLPARPVKLDDATVIDVVATEHPKISLPMKVAK